MFLCRCFIQNHIEKCYHSDSIMLNNWYSSWEPKIHCKKHCGWQKPCLSWLQMNQGQIDIWRIVSSQNFFRKPFYSPSCFLLFSHYTSLFWLSLHSFSYINPSYPCLSLHRSCVLVAMAPVSLPTWFRWETAAAPNPPWRPSRRSSCRPRASPSWRVTCAAISSGCAGPRAAPLCPLTVVP